MPWKRLFRWSLLLFCLGLVAAGCKLADAGANRLTVPRRYQLGEDMQKFVDNPAAEGLTCVQFSVLTAEGLELQAMEVTAGQSRRAVAALAPFREKLAHKDRSLAAPAGRIRGTVLMLHGINSRKEHRLWNARWLAAAGFRCLLYDSRAHGESGGAFATFGSEEVDDAHRVLEVAHQRWSNLGPVAVYGYSMGASVALQTLPVEKEIAAAVAIAPFAELSAVMSYQAGRHYHGALRPMLPLVRWRVSSKAGFDPWDIRPIDAVRRAGKPVFIIHGADDTVVPPEQSAKVLAACTAPGSKRVLVPAATHSNAVRVGGDALCVEMVEFLVSNALPHPAAGAKR